MSDAPYAQTHVRAWRKFRKMSIDELAAVVKMDKGNLSKLERGLFQYDQVKLEAIAKALGTSASVLLQRGPEPATPIWDYIEKASPSVRRQIEAAAEAIYKAAE